MYLFKKQNISSSSSDMYSYYRNRSINDAILKYPDVRKVGKSSS